MDFREAEEFLRRESDRLYVPRIDVEDGYVIYAVVSLYTLFRGGGVRVVDAGAGAGYSTLWIAWALEDVCVGGGCEVVAVERFGDLLDIGRRVLNRIYMRRVEVKFVVDDALSYIADLALESIDIAFVDVDKHQYLEALKLLEEKLRVGGVAMFHNAYRPRPPPSFFNYIETRRDRWSYTVIPTPMGILLAVKKSRTNHTDIPKQF